MEHTSIDEDTFCALWTVVQQRESFRDALHYAVGIAADLATQRNALRRRVQSLIAELRVTHATLATLRQVRRQVPE